MHRATRMLQRIIGGKSPGCNAQRVSSYSMSHVPQSPLEVPRSRSWTSIPAAEGPSPHKLSSTAGGIVTAGIRRNACIRISRLSKRAFCVHSAIPSEDHVGPSGGVITPESIKEYLQKQPPCHVRLQESAKLEFVYELTEEQWRAVATDARCIRVQAGPGSGKTRVLIARMVALLAAGAPATQITAVAFTNMAARELQQRLLQLVGKEITQQLAISTLHALCAQVLRDFGSHNFAKASEEDQQQIVQAILAGHKSNAAMYINKVKQDQVPIESLAVGSLKQISKLKNFIEDINGRPAAELIKEVPGAVILGYEAVLSRHGLSVVYDEYMRLLHSRGLVDCDDLLHFCLQLLRSHPEVLATLRQRWRYYLVDEVQDLNRCQHAIIKLLAGQEAQVFLVGDPNQSIYGFRGASSALWDEQFSAGSRGGVHTLYLSNNYRSVAPIVELADVVRRLNIVEWGNGDHILPGVSMREEQSSNPEAAVTIRQFETQDDEASGLVSTLQGWRDKGYAWRDMAVLYRSDKNGQPKYVYDAVRAAGIPATFKKISDFCESQEVATVATLLELVLHPGAADLSLLRLISIHESGQMDIPLLQGLGKGAWEQLATAYSCSQPADGLGHACFGDLTAPGFTWEAADLIADKAVKALQLSTVPLSEGGPPTATRMISLQLLLHAAPAWEVPVCVQGVLDESELTVIARLRGLVAISRAAAAFNTPPQMVVKLILTASGILGSLEPALMSRAADMDPDSSRSTITADSSLGIFNKYMSLSQTSTVPGLDMRDSVGPNVAVATAVESTVLTQQDRVAPNNPGIAQLTRFYEQTLDKSLVDEDAASSGLQGLDEVQFMTIPQAKGKEWACAALVQANRIGYMSTDSLTDVQQHTNVMYTGVTRAKDKLVLSWFTSRPTQTASSVTTALLAAPSQNGTGFVASNKASSRSQQAQPRSAPVSPQPMKYRTPRAQWVRVVDEILDELKKKPITGVDWSSIPAQGYPRVPDQVRRMLRRTS